MSRDVAALVVRARDEELPIHQQHAAFAELVHRFEEAAFGWSLRSLGDPEEARDATQDAFMAAWLKLRQLREPAAFGSWLKRLIATQCNRRGRKRRDVEMPAEPDDPSSIEHRQQQRLLARALSRLSAPEYQVVVLFYFLGRRIDEIAAIAGVARGTVGKRLHSARIAIRRHLPPALRHEFVPGLRRKISERLLDEYTGRYRFDERPELLVRIEREGDDLVSYGGGQRSVLASIRENALVTVAYDGEGRFQRDGDGRVTQFVYYEFGARLGIARRV